MEDKTGLDRSVLTYVDISLQSPGRFYLIIDESYGKALFTVDQIEVREHEIVAYRDTPTVQVVTRFSPHLPWRMLNTTDVYLQSTKEVMEREGQESKHLREFRQQMLKELGLEGSGSYGGELGDGIATLANHPTGQYL